MKNAITQRNKALKEMRAARRAHLWANMKRDKWLILIALGPVLFLTVFNYVPMFGVFYGLQKVNLRGSFWTNEWVGISHIIDFFEGYYSKSVIRNTLSISIGQLIGSMIAEIGLALLFSEIRDSKFKRITQSLTFFPNFLSVAIVVYMMMNMFAPGNGILTNTLMKWLGYENADVFNNKHMFQPLYILSGIWQGAGWGSIIYLGAINGIDQSLYEAAAIDGAGRLQRIWYITLPCIKVITVTMLILAIGSLMNVGHAKILLMARESTWETSDVISTYVYRQGLEAGDFGMSTAVGLFNTVVNLILLLFANWLSKKWTEVSIF